MCTQFGETPGFRVFQTAPTDSRREITGELAQGVPRYDDLTLSMLMRQGNILKAAFYESGVALTAYLRISGSRHWINWNVQVPHTYDNQTQGLLGNLDGDPNNDFRLRDGIQLSGGIGHQDLFNQYVESCELMNDMCKCFFSLPNISVIIVLWNCFLVVDAMRE